MTESKGNSIATSMIYKTIEKYIMMAFQVVVQIILARLLLPSDYGIVAMMSVFITIANVFIDRGFAQAIIQKKDATNIDYSTAFTINLLIGSTLYLILFFCAPMIARFYNQALLTYTFRVLALILPISSITSIMSSIASREMRFNVIFKCNIVGSFISGCTGIIAALAGLGVWALIIQQLTIILITNIMFLYYSSWRPTIGYNRTSAKLMFNFGWKLLAAGLINEIYNELNSLVIGKKYTSADLAFYSKGKTFPSYVTMGIDNALSTVTLSAFSKQQDNEKYIHSLFQKALITNSYILFPILTILALVANPLISLLLTEKWLPVVPFLQICCFTLAFHPMQALDMQAIASVGRSDIRLKLEFIKKPFGILLLIFAIPYGPMAIALSAALTSIFGMVIGTIACKRCVHYSVSQHFLDIIPVGLASIATGIVVYAVGQISLPIIAKLLLQCFTGVIIYLIISILFKMRGYKYLKEQLQKYINKLN